MKCIFKDISEPHLGERAEYTIKVRAASVPGLYHWIASYLVKNGTYTDIASGSELTAGNARYKAKRAAKRHCKLQAKAEEHGWTVVPR